MSKKMKKKLAAEQEAASENTTAQTLEKDTDNKAPDKKEQDKKQEDSRTDKMQQLEKDVEKEKERYLRLFAEFENYKKRTTKERIDLFKTAGQEVMQSMLPILDDFDRALREIDKLEDDSLFQGVILIYNKLNETLKNKGLQVMPVEAGETFDAEKHEAITQLPAPSEDMKGKIMDVVEKGYLLGDKIVRYPKVVIGQ